MAVFRKGSIELNLGFLAIGGELGEEDRQCAWELYCEIVSRRAVSGRLVDGAESFEGEVLAESLGSLHTFFGRAREIMTAFPVGRIAAGQGGHLAFFIMQMLEAVIRPFLERWQARYRHWWAGLDGRGDPFEKQKGYPLLDEMTEDWTAVRAFCRQTAAELVETYKLVDLGETIPSELRDAWSKPPAGR